MSARSDIIDAAQADFMTDCAWLHEVGLGRYINRRLCAAGMPDVTATEWPEVEAVYLAAMVVIDRKRTTTDRKQYPYKLANQEIVYL